MQYLNMYRLLGVFVKLKLSSTRKFLKHTYLSHSVLLLNNQKRQKSHSKYFVGEIFLDKSSIFRTSRNHQLLSDSHSPKSFLQFYFAIFQQKILGKQPPSHAKNGIMYNYFYSMHNHFTSVKQKPKGMLHYENLLNRFRQKTKQYFESWVENTC